MRVRIIDFHANRGIVSKMLTVLEVQEQMWLPFDCVNQSNVHQFARRLNIKIETRTAIKGGVKGLRIKRVA